MKRTKLPALFILIAAFVLFIFATKAKATFPSDVEIKKLSKDAIVKTVIHLKTEVDLANVETVKAKDELKGVQEKYDAKSKEAEDAKALAIKKEKEAHQNAKERDFWIVLGALGLSAYLGSIFAGSVVRNFPAPESYVIAVGVYVAIFGAIYTAARLFTSTITSHLPF